MAASMGGLLNVTGDTHGPPAKVTLQEEMSDVRACFPQVGVAMTDLATALYAHGAILAALYHRTTTGQGQWLQCNLLATQVWPGHFLSSTFSEKTFESRDGCRRPYGGKLGNNLCCTQPHLAPSFSVVTPR